MQKLSFPEPDAAEGERREAREERALKPHYFGKWLAEAGLPASVVAAILEQDEASDDDNLDGRRLGLPASHEPQAQLNIDVPPDVKQLVVRARADYGVPMKVFVAEAIRHYWDVLTQTKGRKP
jgi:hypothetical protein